VDILPIFKSPAVQVLTFYTGMPARGMEKDITNRMERWTGQSNGMKRQESRSILGASIVRNYFQDDEDLSTALTQVNSYALGVVPNLPPGTLPPVVMPFDPTSTTPVALLALDSKRLATRKPDKVEQILYDVGRYEIRNFIMQNKGASAPVVIGGKIRAVILELEPTKMQARGLSPAEIMKAVDESNVFFPSGDVRVKDRDYALSSNSMFDLVERMKEIPIRYGSGKSVFLGELATPRDSSFIQTNVVRVDGRREVYIPVYRQQGASTLTVVNSLYKNLDAFKAKSSQSDNLDLTVVMDQSVFVRASIWALVTEGAVGAVLCSLVILLFLGQWRMTLIAILTLPLSVLFSVLCLKYTGQTINVMTLAGLTLAIGPMIDSAIICLENTHRHLGMGAHPKEAALEGASEVAMPELVSTLCTFLVLAPLALMPGMGGFLFWPMFLAVFFAMTTAYLLSRTLVPCFSAYLLAPHGHGHERPRGPLGLAFAWWEGVIDRGIALYVRALDAVLRNPGRTVVIAFGLLGVTLVGLTPFMRRDFFPEVDSGAFEIAVRAPSGTRIEVTEKRVAAVEKFIKEHIPEEDLKLVVSEIGVTADWSAAYTPNAGTMDAVVKVQLSPERQRSSQHYIRLLRDGFNNDPQFAMQDPKSPNHLEFSFDSGGLVRGALNEGKSSPINIRLLGKKQDVLFTLADRIKAEVRKVPGVVDARVLERPDYPEWTVNVDRSAAVDAGLNQAEIMQNVIAALNSSITYNKRNFWIDPLTHNQYYVGVQYPEDYIRSKEDLLNIPITSPTQGTPIPLSNLVTSIQKTKVPTEVVHANLQPSVDLTMNVEGRDLGHVSDDISRKLDEFGTPQGVRKEGLSWAPFDPRSKEHKLLGGARIVLAGEYARMRETFLYLGGGMILASLLIYFLMVALDRSFIVPLAVMSIVPLSLVGILPMLFITGSAINVQSLLGFIFIIGIKVANTVLMTDYAQELRRHEGLSPLAAIRKAASLRVRPVTMTALAAFFAMIPTALALEKGSEANAPLARAILGGLLAGEPATLFVLPAVYSLLVRDRKVGPAGYLAAHEGHPPEMGIREL
jgi:multidrug efflux pump subunit AcrB